MQAGVLDRMGCFLEGRLVVGIRGIGQAGTPKAPPKPSRGFWKCESDIPCDTIIRQCVLRWTSSAVASREHLMVVVAKYMMIDKNLPHDRRDYHLLVSIMRQ